jgi:predicted DsbA family dithiol-disulfide isomerase
MSPRPTVRVDVISDVVCPWCYLGQKRLDKAVAAVPDVDVAVSWRRYQLDPTIPPEGKDREAYMLAKFGDRSRIEAIHDRLKGLGTADGIAYDFNAIKVAANTLDAHRVIHWAGQESPAVQDRVVRALFAGYFERGRNIGDPAVLADAAREAGMDGAVVEKLLAGDADCDVVREEIGQASRMGVSGVPCFVLEGKYAVSGAQDVSVLQNAIEQVAGMKARGEL